MGYYRSPAKNWAPRPAPAPSVEDQQLCERLSSLLPTLPAKDHPFAQSLIDSCANQGSLTPGRREWVGKLIDRALNPPAAPVAVDLAGIRKMFDAAVSHLKHPKVRLQADDGTPVVIGMAGPSSKYPGQLMVTDGGPYMNNRWFGRVDGASFHSARACTDTVRGLLTSLSTDPAAIVARHGKLTGCCALCGKQLSDAESIERGVGPVCLKKWGLVPGAVPAARAASPIGVRDFAPTVEID